MSTQTPLTGVMQSLCLLLQTMVKLTQVFHQPKCLFPTQFLMQAIWKRTKGAQQTFWEEGGVPTVGKNSTWLWKEEQRQHRQVWSCSPLECAKVRKSALRGKAFSKLAPFVLFQMACKFLCWFILLLIKTPWESIFSSSGKCSANFWSVAPIASVRNRSKNLNKKADVILGLECKISARSVN